MQRRGFLAALVAVAATPRTALARLQAFATPERWAWRELRVTITSSRADLTGLYRKVQGPLQKGFQFMYEEWDLPDDAEG